MDQNVSLSVILCFRNQRDIVEPTLTALYEMNTIPFELIIIDDASNDGTVEAIRSLLDYYQHEHTFFFEHAQATGRGNALNEALLQASSSLIWAPVSIGDIDEAALESVLDKLRSGNAPCLLQNITLPNDFAERARLITDGTLPADGQMVWNTEAMPSQKRFFNPFLNRHHGFDLLLRLGMDAMRIEETFFTPSDFEPDTAPSTGERQDLILSCLRRPETSAAERQQLLDLLNDLPPITNQTTFVDDEKNPLEKAVELKLEGQLSAALELVEQILQDDPANPEAKNLKIKILERKRRFVEASELKHELQVDSRTNAEHPKLNDEDVKTSLIIPTSLYGKPALEHCLISVNQHGNPARTECIIIDNASLDGTHDYLDELQEKNFFNCRVIKNAKNQGFAASVNQGLEAARGQYACIIHNDIEFSQPVITQLEHLMDDHPDYALMGPLADSTLNPDQLLSTKDLYDEQVVETDYLDSFCMMMRTEAGLKMDEAYTLAFFDDIDLCFQAREQGHKVGIVPGAQVTHHYGTTTFALDLDTESDLYWKNIAYFNDKWDVQTHSEEDLRSKSHFEQLLILDEWVNPLYPEPAIKEKFDKLFTDEVKTEILKSSHEPEELLHLIHLLMVMDRRDVMRELEDRTADMELPAALIYEIVRFYFNRNVYSRCQHYLNKLTGQQESLQSDLYRLAILIDEKKMDDAVPMLTALLDRAPSNPELYKLAGDVHAFQNNAEEAKSFYALANQINPFEFSEAEQEIKLNS